ncbi:MAG TPA: CHAT domain-containing tetratricopeptide repeat protein [Chitinophagales bacterium]|nr:CHAT domain-containing tetratricopeptide repeat protein [Chitinophagales bacterium]
MLDKSIRYQCYSFLWMCLLFINGGEIYLNAQTKTKEQHIFVIKNSTNLDSIQKSKLQLSKLYVKNGHLDSSRHYFSQINIPIHNIFYQGLYQEVKGLILFEEGKYNSSISSFQQAIQFYQKESKEEVSWQVLENKNNIGRAWITLNEFEPAKKIYKQIFQSLQSIRPSQIDSAILSRMYNNMGVIHFYEGALDAAFTYYDKSRTISTMSASEKDINVGRALYNMGLVREEKGFLIDASVLYQKALEIYLHNYGPFHHHIAEVYGSLGNIHLTRFEFNKAQYYFQKDLETSNYLYGEGHVETTWGYENLGRLYQEEGKDSLAHQMFEKVLKIRTQYFHGKNISIANVLLNLAEIEKNTTQSIDYAQKALKVENSISSQATIGKWNISIHLLQKYIQLHQYSKAQKELKNAIALGEQIFPSKRHPSFIKTYLLGSKIYSNQKQYKKSLEFLNKAIKSSLAENIQWNLQDIVNTEWVEFKPQYLEAIVEKSNILFEMGLQTQQMSYLEQASKDLYSSISVIQKHQKRRTSDDIGKRYFQLYKKLYETGLKINYHIWKTTRNKKYLYQAFEFAERNKNGLSIELLQGMDVFSISNLPETTLRREYQLKKDIQYYQSLSIDGDELQQQKALQKLMLLYNEETTFYQNLERFHPQYYHSKYEFEPITLQKIQSKIPNKEALMWHTTFVDEVEYIFLISKNNVQTYDYKAANYAPIITKIAQNKYQELIIIPDFSTKWSRLEAYQLKGQYLIEKWSFIYNVSATNYYITPNKNRIINKKLLAIAPVSFKNEELSTLKYSVEEIQKIEKYFPIKSFIGNVATKKVFNDNVLKYGGLHLLSHISYNPLNPMKSKLFLSPMDSLDDGVLYAHDIFGIPMRTQIVTLSACEAKKDQQDYNGIAGIADAFSYNGCKNILHSLWQVEDKTMKEITVGFYKYLSKGHSKEKALQLSKIDYLKSADKYKSESFYWSGIILQGNVEALELSPTAISKYSMWIALLLLIIALIVIKKL